MSDGSTITPRCSSHLQLRSRANAFVSTQFPSHPSLRKVDRRAFASAGSRGVSESPVRLERDSHAPESPLTRRTFATFTEMTSRILFVAVTLAVSASMAAGQLPQYIQKNYTIPPVSGATTCVKNFVGNTPATCPYPLVPYANATTQAPGSTVCVASVNGQNYETVFSLMEPSNATTAVPGCTSNAQCGEGTNPGFICGTNGPSGVGVPNTCFPLAPSGCPFTGDVVNATSATGGRKMVL